MSSTSVNVDFVLKQMKKTGRNVFYIEDSMGNVLDYSNEPDLKLDDACQRLEDALDEISGRYAYVRLHHKAAGSQNKSGGVQQPILKYKVELNGRADQDEKGGRSRGLSGSGEFGLFRELLSEIHNLKTQMAVSAKDVEIERLKEKVKETKDNSHEPTIDLFVKKAFNKYIEYENIKGNAKGKATPLADDQAKPHEAQTERLLAIFKNLEAVDKNYLENLDRVSRYIKDNEAFYHGFIEQIKQAGY